jgi:ComF family protein
LDAIEVAHVYGSTAALAIRTLKYARIQELAQPLGAAMAARLPNLAPFDVAVPVPIHWSRLAERGFNQAELLTRAAGLKTSRLLRRRRATMPQARLSAAARIANLQNAFTAIGGARGMRVLLVDDVFTTGTTLVACAGALKAAGASWVGALTFAVRPPDG